MKEFNIQNKEKTNSWGKFIFLGLIFLFVFFIYESGKKHSEYIKTFKGETICFTTKIKRSNKSTFLKYYFYSNKRVLGEISSSNQQLVNRFYLVKYDLNNPSANYIVLDREIKPDSIVLVKAGFRKIKYYIYDAGVTCKYIEKSKWQ